MLGLLLLVGLLLLFVTLCQSLSDGFALGSGYYHPQENWTAFLIPCSPCSLLLQATGRVRDNCRLCAHNNVLGLNMCGMCGSVFIASWPTASSTRFPTLALSDASYPVTFSLDSEQQQQQQLPIYATTVLIRFTFQPVNTLIQQINHASKSREYIWQLPWIEWIHPVPGAVIRADPLPFSTLRIAFAVHNIFISQIEDNQNESDNEFDVIIKTGSIKFEDILYSSERDSNSDYLPVLNDNSKLVAIDHTTSASIARSDYEFQTDIHSIEGSNFLKLSLVSPINSIGGLIDIPLFSTSNGFTVLPSDEEFGIAKGFIRSAVSASITGQSQQSYSKFLSEYLVKSTSFGANLPNETDTDSNSEEPTMIHIMHVMGGGHDGSQAVVFQRWNLLLSLSEDSNSIFRFRFKFSLLWVCVVIGDMDMCELSPTVTNAIAQFGNAIHVRYLHPIRVSPSVWADGGSISLLSYCNQRTPTTDLLYEYAVVRLRAANRVIEKIEPVWVQQLWKHYLNAIANAEDSVTESSSNRNSDLPDILIFGNSGLVQDVMLTEAALSLRSVAVVLDTSTIDTPHRLLQYHAVTGPSTYALYRFHQIRTENTARVTERWYGYHHTPPSVPSHELSTEQIVCPHSCSSLLSPTTQQSISSIATAIQSSAQGRNRCSKACTIVGFVGRLVKVKFPTMFLEVAKALLSKSVCTNCVFWMIGGGPFRSYLEEYATRLGVRDYIEFAGEIRPREMPRYMAAIDILVTPSIFKSETFCLVNLEAMAVGVPVVSFAVYGMGDYMTPSANASSFSLHQHGLEINSLSPDSLSSFALAGQVEELLYNRTLRGMISKNALQTARSYSQSNSNQHFQTAMTSIYVQHHMNNNGN